MAETLCVVGLGYSGEAIARLALERGMRLIVVGRFSDGVPEAWASQPGLNIVQSDAAALDQRPPTTQRIDTAVITFGTRESPETLLGPTLRWLASCGAKRVLYLSSTSVYGDHLGEEVDDQTPRSPNTAMGERRVAAEDAFAALATQLSLAPLIMRMPGIYGPGRTPRQRLLAGSYPVVAGEDRWTNRIHVQDVASAALLLLQKGEPGGAWVASDGTPFQTSTLVNWMCETLGIEPPVPVPFDEVPARSKPFLSGSRRLIPRGLLALGWRPEFPDVLEGHRLAWEQEDGGNSH